MKATIQVLELIIKVNFLSFACDLMVFGLFARVGSKDISPIFLFPETDYFAQSCFSARRCLNLVVAA